VPGGRQGGKREIEAIFQPFKVEKPFKWKKLGLRGEGKWGMIPLGILEK
jgi:hypothetical protein